MDRKVEELSVVQQQVVEIVKALSVTASVLIMDEPSAALTDKELRKLFEIIRTLTAQGVTVIYISHMLEEVFEIADRVTVLKDGRVMGTRPTGELAQGRAGAHDGRTDHRGLLPPARRRPGPVLLEVRGLGLRGKLDGIGLELHAGEILGVAGMVGSGRNLLARCILGLEPWDAGEIVVKGGPCAPAASTTPWPRGSATSPTTARRRASSARCPCRRT